VYLISIFFNAEIAEGLKDAEISTRIIFRIFPSFRIFRIKKQQTEYGQAHPTIKTFQSTPAQSRGRHTSFLPYFSDETAQ